MTPEEEILYTRCRAFAMIDAAMSKSVLEEARAAIRAAVLQEREQCAAIARENEVYWNSVAYDKRQAGKSDIDPSARAGKAAIIADAIEARE